MFQLSLYYYLFNQYLFYQCFLVKYSPLNLGLQFGLAAKTEINKIQKVVNWQKCQKLVASKKKTCFFTGNYWLLELRLGDWGNVKFLKIFIIDFSLFFNIIIIQ